VVRFGGLGDFDDGPVLHHPQSHTAEGFEVSQPVCCDFFVYMGGGW
jgi:hypothetical protein